MISDITLGQFFPGRSPIHRLDPRTKILLATLFIISVFLANNPVSFAFLAIVTIVIISLSSVSFKVMLKGVKPIIFLLLFTAFLNVFMTKGAGEPLVSFWVLEIYSEGIARALMMALRVIMLIIGTSVLLTYTTSPISLTDGLEALLSPLKKLNMPVHTFAMMMSIALRFIPTLIEETEKIMNAQKSRGADFTSGTIVDRAKALIPLLIPLFVSSFKRAEELATAMECRCYRGDNNRTKLVKLEYKALDYIYLVVFVFILITLICLTVLPYQFNLSGVIFDIILYRV